MLSKQLISEVLQIKSGNDLTFVIKGRGGVLPAIKLFLTTRTGVSGPKTLFEALFTVFRKQIMK